MLRETFATHTVIAVSHDLDDLLQAEMIMVMDSGVLVEHGTPQTLLANAGGHFSQLVATRGGL